ncbi:hypothetical protein BD310DRAFT_918553 [Dichomitus squalens]|uniref:Uncharacterized protein n=1 Tax=Dichomitus squalens TaxID=114155 RepID=A0A4V2K950_9APHY|nr:hypothetical protein BD310DRAFT_918553 [Dichomitus squalens]
MQCIISCICDRVVLISGLNGACPFGCLLSSAVYLRLICAHVSASFSQLEMRPWGTTSKIRRRCGYPSSGEYGNAVQCL